VWPSWSPDGKRILFAADDQFYLGSNYGGVVKNPVWVIDADGRHKRKLYAADALHAVPVWSPDGRSILFVSDRDGAHDVYRQEIGDSLIGPLQRVTVGANVYTFSLSANGSRMAYNSLHFDEGTNIWAAPIGETTTPFSAARPVTRGRQEIKSFSISHDGQWLAFDSDRDADGYVHIYKVALDGRRVRGDPIRLTHQHADDGDPQWAPGDSEIVFYRKAGEHRNVYVIRADGRREMRVTTDTMLNEYHPDWSSDGRTVVYTAHLRTDDDRYHVFIATRDAKGRWGEPTELLGPPSAGAVARWAPMGDQIVQWPGTLRVLDAKTGSVRKYLTNAALGERISASYWGGDTAAIYLRSVDSNRVASFWKYDLHTATPRRLLTITDSSRTNRHQFFDVSGQTLFLTISPAGSEVFVAALTWR
jgi:TolB protein